MEIPVYRHDYGACPYLPDRNWVTQFFQTSDMPEALYESLLNVGWRRSSNIFYLNDCENCKECIPIRVDADNFKASKSQRKCLNKNADIRIEREPATFRQQDFELFKKYDESWHDSKHNVDEESYRQMNVESPLCTEVMRYFIADELVGLSWIDVLPNAISSVYFSFDPDFSERSLGVFSMLKEIELCRDLGKRWLQVGFYIKGCKKMNYKSKYKPYQLLIDNEWVDPVS